MPDSKIIGERIKSLRKKFGLSQAELANKIGVSTSTIGMYERGDRIPRDEIKIRLAETLNRSVHLIFFKE